MSQADIEMAAYTAVMKYDVEGSKKAANDAVAQGADLVAVINNGYTKAITEVGDLFGQKKLFLPHIMAAAGALTAGMEIIEPELAKQGGDVGTGLGTVVICTIEGDIHSIGKDIVAIMLKVAGFDVKNIGRDVALDTIVQACIDNKADAVGTSALMTSTMVGQKTFEEKLKAAGIRDKLLTNVGGAPVTQQWADEIGADLYTENATDASAKFAAAFEKK